MGTGKPSRERGVLTQSLYEPPERAVCWSSVETRAEPISAAQRYRQTNQYWGLSSNGTEMYAKGVGRYLPEMRLRRIQE